MTPAHAAALALLDQITPGPWRSDGDDMPWDVSIFAGPEDKTFIANVGGSRIQEVMVAFDVDAVNGRAIAALPELAALYRETARYHQASVSISFATTEAERLQRISEMLAAWEAVVAALAAVADKLTGEGK